jgi:hypothetical protein
MILGTTIGEGCAIVTAHYAIDDDGDVELLEVLMSGVDIIDALHKEDIDELIAECLVHAKAQEEQDKADGMIAKFESDKE